MRWLEVYRGATPGQQRRMRWAGTHPVWIAVLTGTPFGLIWGFLMSLVMGGLVWPLAVLTGIAFGSAMAWELKRGLPPDPDPQ